MSHPSVPEAMPLHKHNRDIADGSVSRMAPARRREQG